MKTNELVTKLVDMGLEVTRLDDLIRVTKDGVAYAEVLTERMYTLDTLRCGPDSLEENTEHKLLKVLFEYASTPIEEREEKKRYLYHLKDIADATTGCHKHGRFLNYCASEDAFTIANKNESSSYKTIFEEDDPLLERVNLDMFDKIEVDEDGNAI